MPQPGRWRPHIKFCCCAALPALLGTAHAELALERRDMGLCVSGPLSRLPDHGSIERLQSVAQGLGADVFAVLVTKGRVELPSMLSGWLTSHVVFEDGTGPATLRSEYFRANLGNRSGDLLTEYASIGGNFLGPLVGNDGRNAFMLRDLWRCLQLVQSHEHNHRVWYSYYGYSRLDTHWLGQPPALDLLRSTDSSAIWIPDGQDWDGLNDRFAIVPRRWARAYFGRWPELLNGSLLPMVRRAAGDQLLDLKFDAGPEWLLRAALRSVRAPVKRFDTVAAVLCEPHSKRGRYGRCTKPWAPHGLMFKYSSEASEAHVNIGRLQTAGWQWRASRMSPSLSPECFTSEDQRRNCCSATAGLNGDPECWTDVYSYSRCCWPQRRDGLWILPSVLKARELSEAKKKVCWQIVSAVSMCLSVNQLEVLSEEMHDMGVDTEREQAVARAFSSSSHVSGSF